MVCDSAGTRVGTASRQQATMVSMATEIGNESRASAAGPPPPTKVLLESRDAHRADDRGGRCGCGGLLADVV
jgi:hypothetical protein